MNILMLTNVYSPQIGGVTRSLEQFSAEFRERGHNVLIMAPDYEENPQPDDHVIRVPAIPNFYQGKYSLPIPVLPALRPEIKDFQPDIVHSHHPFLLGSTAQSIAAEYEIPLVYTHHTRYAAYLESNADWPHAVEEALLELITGYCELVDAVVAPSDGMQKRLRRRGVKSRIDVISTGVDVDRFSQGDGRRFREKHGVDHEAFIVGHCGRLSAEKNIGFLSEALVEFQRRSPKSRVVIVGDGPERQRIEHTFHNGGSSDRVIMTGFLEGQDLVDAYQAMDLFAFASHNETQGMVVTEAMAASTPVVAMTATGVEDVVKNGHNGYLIKRDELDDFVDAISRYEAFDSSERQELQAGAIATAEDVSQSRCATKMLDLYRELIASNAPHRHEGSTWNRMHHQWEAAWLRWKSRSRAAAKLVREAISPQK